MRPAFRLLSANSLPPVHLTLFTRASCGLCTAARGALSKVWERRPFDYSEIDIDAPGTVNKRWKDVYEFDVPVVHVRHSSDPAEEVRWKGMHRIREEEVVNVLDDIVAKGKKS